MEPTDYIAWGLAGIIGGFRSHSLAKLLGELGFGGLIRRFSIARQRASHEVLCAATYQSLRAALNTFGSEQGSPAFDRYLSLLPTNIAEAIQQRTLEYQEIINRNIHDPGLAIHLMSTRVAENAGLPRDPLLSMSIMTHLAVHYKNTEEYLQQVRGKYLNQLQGKSRTSSKKKR